MVSDPDETDKWLQNNLMVYLEISANSAIKQK